MSINLDAELALNLFSTMKKTLIKELNEVKAACTAKNSKHKISFSITVDEYIEHLDKIKKEQECQCALCKSMSVIVISDYIEAKEQLDSLDKQIKLIEEKIKQSNSA